MAPKAKKQAPEAAPAEEPAAKKAKADEEPKKEEEKKEEEPKFEEPDAPKDSRPALKTTIGFDTANTTLNVVPTVGGKVLAGLSDGGMCYLMAGARANVGQKAGRYMFEAKIIQNTDSSHGSEKLKRMIVRIGFSTADHALVLGDHSSSGGAIFFDCDGGCTATKGRRFTPKGNCRFAKDQVVAVVLNLDPKSPNANTAALYRDGVAVGEPQKLAEDLAGKELFPHISYRSCTVSVNFGPT